MPTTTRLPDSELLEAVIEISRHAGREILDVYGTDFEARAKADDSPLTEADLRAHRLIIAELARLSPVLPVLSEEAADIPYARAQRLEPLLAGGIRWMARRSSCRATANSR